MSEYSIFINFKHIKIFVFPGDFLYSKKASMIAKTHTKND